MPRTRRSAKLESLESPTTEIRSDNTSPTKNETLLPSLEHTPATDQALVVHSGDDVGLIYMKQGCLPLCERAAEEYIHNCEKYGVSVDPGVVISLRTGWHVMHPTKFFSEGAMLPLLGVLDNIDHIQQLNLSDTSMQDKRFRSRGNGNSNARILNFILRKNTSIEEVNLSNTGLDDAGLDEVSHALRTNATLKKLNLSGNYFGLEGTIGLTSALSTNSSLEQLDISRNALSFQAINMIETACACRDIAIVTHGNYIFEEILNSVSHGVALIFAIIGSIILMTEATETYNTDYHFWGCLIFSFTLMFLFAVSTLFHSFFMLPTASYVLQILDHVGIYMLIAGSYTPFMMIGLHNYTSATVLLIAEWVAALAGTAFVTGADLNAPSTTRVELTAFCIMGGAALFVWRDILEGLSASAVKLLLAGGAAYVVGIIFFVWGVYKPIYHSVWHLFVVLGAGLHWFAVYFFIVNTKLGGKMETVMGDCMRDGIQMCVEELSQEFAHMYDPGVYHDSILDNTASSSM